MKQIKQVVMLSTEKESKLQFKRGSSSTSLKILGMGLLNS